MPATPLNINGISEIDLTLTGGTVAATVSGDVMGVTLTPASGVTLQTNGTPNGSQSLLNLKNGTNVTISDDGVGGVTIASSGGGGTTQLMYEPKVNLVSGASRAIATTKNVYQNTTGNPIIVVVSANTGATANVTYNAYTDASNPPTTVVATITGCNNATSGQSAIGMAFFVKPNEYYAVTISTGTATLANWKEIQLASGAFTSSGEISASRALATVYQNTSGKTRWVLAQVQSVNASSAVQGFADTFNPPTSMVDDATHTSNAAKTVTILMVVPNNYYYKITAATGSLLTWYEYDWAVSCTRYGNLCVTGSSFFRSSNYVSRGNNSGTATTTINQFQIWFNDSGNGRWVSAITTNSVAQSSFNMTVGEGIPPWTPNQLTFRCNQNASVNRRVMAPVPAWKFYWIDDTTSGTVTHVAWYEYDFTP